MMGKSFTPSECIASIIQQIIPESDFRRQMQSVANHYLDRTQDELLFGFLPTIICSVISDESEKAIPITAAWQLIQLAAKLFDDIEDGDTTKRIANTANLATGLLFTAYTAWIE